MRRQTLKNSLFTGVLALVFLLLPAMGAGATEIQGRISSTSYIYETYGEDAHSELDLINRLAFDAKGLGHESLSLHLLGTFRGEMLHEDSDDPEMSFHRGYLKFAPSKLFKLSAGRQRVHGRVG
nr:hypothetical protein [bacterium]